MSLLWSCGSSFCLGCCYVASLYIWSGRSNLDRDHPWTIKRRFVSAFLMLFLSPPFLYVFGAPELIRNHSLKTLLGIKMQGFWAACVLPLMLTWILFLGPIVMTTLSDTRIRLMLMPRYWLDCFRDLIWWRNHAVAPFTEEFTFRACMVPILLGYYSPQGAVVVAPLFFGIAHLHHMIERIRKGHQWKEAIIISLFQMTYTTIFGMYSAFLFLRTGHLAAPVLSHSFCNFMGFPDVVELWNHKPQTRLFLIGVFVFGLVSFLLLLFPMTEPAIYGNKVYQW